MRDQLDRGLQDRGLEAVVVCGSPAVSWETAYLVGPLKVNGGYVFKRVGEDPVFVAKHVERHEAAKGQCSVVSFEEMGIDPILHADMPRAQREAAVIEQILDHHDCKGKVAIYGSGPISTFAECLHILRERRPKIFHDYPGRRSLFQEAILTKERSEIERIDRVGRRVEDVFRNTLNYLTTLISEGGRVFDIEGEPITIGDIKDMVVREAGKRRLDIPEDVIFSQGALSAIPNNTGESDQVLRSGVPVVFDLVGRERRGFFFEITRTFCVGGSNPRFEEVYQDVAKAREIALENARPGRTGQQMNDAVSEYLESRGYATLRQGAREHGMVHSLGHGIGLEHFEEPIIGPVEEELEIQAGMVLSIKPGIYLPEEGFGARMSDVVVVEPGGPRRLTRVAYPSSLPLSG